MMLEHLERRVLTERQVSAMIAVAVGGGELVDVDHARDTVLGSLTALPEVVDRDRMDMLVALGLR